MLLIIKIKFLPKKFSTPWYKYSNVEVENLSLGRPVSEWGGCLSSTINDHLLGRQRKNIDQWEQLTWWLGCSIHKRQRTHTASNNRHQNIEKLPATSRGSYARVIIRDLIPIKVSTHSYVACKIQHFRCCVQHSTFPVLNTINMFALCNPCIVT